MSISSYNQLQAELNEYQYILFNTIAGKPGRMYLKQRNILPATAKFWGLGFCPKNFVPQIYKNNSNSQQVMLQNRIIIPIYNANGKLISIGGRKIDNTNITKYTNYPFSTSRNLFGLFVNKNTIREKNIAIITEGQLDVISAWQKGLSTIVCSFGAHSGLEQIALLSRYTNNICVVFDADTAGLNGLNTLKKLNTYDINLNLITNIFPTGYDLDNWIQEHSAQDFYDLINKNSLNILNDHLSNQLNNDIF